jgi:hypothetical protein
MWRSWRRFGLESSTSVVISRCAVFVPVCQFELRSSHLRLAAQLTSGIQVSPLSLISEFLCFQIFPDASLLFLVSHLVTPAFTSPIRMSSPHPRSHPYGRHRHTSPLEPTCQVYGSPGQALPPTLAAGHRKSDVP